MKLFSSQQLYEADAQTVINQQIKSVDLMERAGIQIFNWLHKRMQGAQVPIHIFCGIGDNGGDGLVVGRLLVAHGYSVHTYVVNSSDKRSKNFLINYDRIKNVTKDWPSLMTSEEDFPPINPDDIIIDGIFGIGLNRCPVGWVKKLIQYINEHKAFTLAIDIPSGLYANQPIKDPEAVIKANHTLTFQAPKLAFFLPETGGFVPYHEVLDIELDAEYLATTEALALGIDKPEVQQFYKQREKYSHKGTYGHALMVAGSYGKIGAAVLASKAALRIGAGLVSVCIPKCGYNILQMALPEAMVITAAENDYIDVISTDFEPAAIGVGMGIGQHKSTIAALKKLFSETKSSVIIDADAINCIAKDKTLLKLLPKHSILTLHPGELERLIGSWTDDYDKLKKTKRFAKKHEIVLVIKGANTITVFEEKLYINTTGNPGMATAGSGDVLSGVITGLRAQGYDPLTAAIFGAYLHGSAGNIASQEIGFEAMIASDITENLGNAYLALFEQEPPEEQPEEQ